MSDTPELAEVRAAEEARRLAMLHNDPVALAPLVCDELIYTHSSGLKDSKSSWLKRMTSGALRYERVDFVDLAFTVIEQTALVTGRMDASLLRAGQPGSVSSMYLAVWVKRAGHWQLLAIQGTPAPSPA